LEFGIYNEDTHRRWPIQLVAARNITSVPRLTAGLPAECWRRFAADAREALPRSSVRRSRGRAIALRVRVVRCFWPQRAR